jgi:transposase-like protein
MLGRKPVSTKGLRCGVPSFCGSDYRARCNRPAKRYRVQFGKEFRSVLDICKQHVQSFIRAGYTMTVIDRRKEKV